MSMHERIENVLFAAYGLLLFVIGVAAVLEAIR